MIIIDASALADVLLGRRPAVEALLDVVSHDAAQTLHAPQIIEPEILSAVRRLELSGVISAQRARLAVGDLGDTRLVRWPHEPLRERVWALRHNLTAYDASYLALAEALDEPVLLTADHGLAHAARRTLGDGAIRLIDT